MEIQSGIFQWHSISPPQLFIIEMIPLHYLQKKSSEIYKFAK